MDMGESGCKALRAVSTTRKVLHKLSPFFYATCHSKGETELFKIFVKEKKNRKNATLFLNH